MQKAIFYHAGCPVCTEAEQKITTALDKTKYNLEIVHLGKTKGRINEAKLAGVKSVPVIILEGSVFHINFGANLSDLN